MGRPAAAAGGRDVFPVHARGQLADLLGVISLVVVHYQHSAGNVLTFSIPELTSRPGRSELGRSGRTRARWGSPQVVIFLLLLAGFAIKVPLFPFHTWLPLAHVEAPTAGSILLAGVLLKVGTYGLIRFNLGMTPLASASLFRLMATLSVIGIIYGALAALAQTDIKRLVAYSSVSHMGFIVLGIFALNSTALDGVVDSDAQPRLDDRGSLCLRGDDLRAVSHARHQRDRRPVEPAADPGVLPDPGGPGLGGRARTERVCRRVSDSGRHVRDEQPRRACWRRPG